MYQCPKCSKTLEDLGVLYGHLTRHHDIRPSDAYDMCTDAKVVVRKIDDTEKLLG